MQVSLEHIYKIALMVFKLTKPYEDNGNPTRYNMLGPIVRAGRNDDAHNKLTDEHALNEINTPNIVNVTISVCTYLHCLQELKVYDQPCLATLSQGL